MAEWFVGRILDTLINTCFEYLQDQFGSQAKMEKEQQRLRENHPKIQAVLFAAGQAPLKDQNPAINNWIWQLRDAIDEADDMLDEFAYTKREEQLTENEKKRKVGFTNSFLSESSTKIRQIGKHALKIDPNLKRLEEVVQKLDKVSAKVGTFLRLLKNTKQVQQQQELELYRTRETGSLPKNDLIGRSKDKEFVLQWLKRSSNEKHQPQITATTLHNNVSLLSIVGHGGMGKTTLLQHVYEDEVTKEFDLKMWVCVSNNFDVKKVIADMLESLKKKKPDLESLDALQGSLKSEVQSKKFLLVLDDIWDEEEEKDKRKWENVLAPLAYGSLGSKILVKTRMDSAAGMITKVIKKKKETLRLKGLEEDECLQLLGTHAFADVENPGDFKKLRSIAGEMVKKLLGSPLAAKVIGGVLNSNLDERHWIRVLNNDIGSSELVQNDILHILRLSYTFLSKPLQNCFAFCGIFPQDHGFHKDDLIRMWIALGFIQPTYIQGETMEDIGGRYFNILIQKSFFDKFNFGNYYKMHDLLHELAQSIFTQEGFRVLSADEFPFKIPETTRHLYIETSNLEVLRKIRNLKNLRSLCLAYNKDSRDFVDVLTEIFEASKSLRLLYIRVPCMKMIPEVVGYLKHLRYLRLDECHVTRLPRSLSNLYHLQFMSIDKYARDSLDDFLPRDINNLFNLRYLKFFKDEFPKIHGIGKLKYLQNLGFFVRNESGYTIGELEQMNDLHQLRIKHLENLKNPEEACNAKLCVKRNLTNLTLEWGHIPASSSNILHVRGTRKNVAVPDLDERVLDNLQPHNNLRKLTIKKYMGVRSAIWMNKAYLICNLEQIHLIKCLEWQTLPPFGQLPFLKSLYLLDMPKVKRIANKFHGNDKGCIFPSLEVLHIEKLEALEVWFDAATTTDDGLFPCLTELYLYDCPNLQELPYLPPKLKEWRIYNIGWKTFRFCNVSKSIPLEVLMVLGCPNITYISLADFQTALRYLTIQDCPNLISLGGHQVMETTENRQLILSHLLINDPFVLVKEPLRSIASVEMLTILKNGELISFSVEAEQWFLKVSSSLRQLSFRNLKSLQSLPSSLESLSSLKILNLVDIPLQKLPDLPTSLQELHISDLNNLDCQPSCLPSLYSLKTLSIIRIPQLRQLPDLPPTLCKLMLEENDNLNCLPSCFPNLSFLRQLSIINAPQLQELPDLPSSLCVLMLAFCHPKLEERYNKFSGSDWHKIAHIHQVTILPRWL